MKKLLLILLLLLPLVARASCPTFAAGDLDYITKLNTLSGCVQTPAVDAGGTVNAITATFNPALTLTNHTIALVVSAGANTSTTPTFAPDGLTAHTITTRGGQALRAGDIGPAGFVAQLEYNSANTRWELVNPVGLALGTPSSATLTNATGLPISGITGLGTGVGTALAVNVGTAGSPVINGGALGSPSSVGTMPSYTMGGSLLFTDATYDIGASGATRPRDIFASRNGVFGGTLNVGGITTLNESIIFTGNHGFRSNTVDGSDNQYHEFSGGGSSDESRGGFLQLAGNESAIPGAVRIHLGNNGGYFNIYRYDGTTEAFRLEGSNGAVSISATLAVTGAYYSGTTIGVTCAGAPTGSFASTKGIVTHC